MNYGIGNVKAKSSGGGGIPQITIEATQFTDATHIQFTEEQYNTIVNNGCVNIDIAGSGTLLFTMQNNSINANVYLYSVSDNYTASTNAIEFATIELNKTTYVGTLNQNSYEKSSGGKQLYIHNIAFNITNDCYVSATIINDSAEKINTKTKLLYYLINNSLGDFMNCLSASGMCRKTTYTPARIIYIHGIAGSSTSLKVFGSYINNSNELVNDTISVNPTQIFDVVITL